MKELIKKISVQGPDVFVEVATTTIKEFKERAVAEYGPRKNKRLNKNTTSFFLVAHHIRDTMDMKGKHIKIHVCAADKTGKLRDEKGHYVKLNEVATSKPDTQPAAEAA